MPDNRIEYALGLATGNFLSGIKSATAAFAGLAGAASIAQGVMGTIEKGAGLQDLSKRTGESVSSLVRLQRGFEMAGISGGSVATALFQMQKAIGGINDAGESTKDIFAKMGLDSKSLAGMSGEGAIAKIIEGLSKMDRASASLAASKIFGRGGAQDMLQLAHNADDFAEGVERASRAAEVFGRNAGAFDQFSKELGKIKQQVSDLLLDPAAITANFGLAMKKAFKDGNAMAIVEAGMSAAMESAVESFAQGMFATVVALPQLVATAFKNLPALLSDALASSTFGALGSHYQAKAEQSQSLTGRLYYRAAAGLAQTGAQNIAGYSSEGAAMISADIAKALKDAGSALENLSIGNGARQRFLDLIQQKNDPNQPNTDPAADPFGTGGKRRAGTGPEANALERIGAIFGGGNVAMDYAKNTAQNTAEIARGVKDLKKAIVANTRGGSGEWAFTS